jgi:DNA-binding response OmpR family regulator
MLLGRLQHRRHLHVSDPLPVVLVVDDEVAMANAVRRTLRGIAQVRAAFSVTSGKAAIESERDVCLFVFDLDLQDGTGWDLLAHARAHHGAAPVLILSGNGSEGVLTRAAAAGARFLSKPFESAELRELVRNHCCKQ